MITGIVVALLLAVIVFQYMTIKIDKDKRHEAGHDKLTGLCNPEHLMQKMKELPDKKKNRLIIYSDIAEFKLINEIFGIEKGNEILLKQADIIKKHAVDGYLYGRVGEDHFVVIADEDTFNEEYLYECRETLQNVLSDSVYNVRVCFGIYRTDNMNESLSFMCDKASFAVASIKDDTHSFIAYYDDTMLEAAIKYKTIVDEFDDAIKAGEFKMYLQPQISAKTRRLTGAEALVRSGALDVVVVDSVAALVPKAEIDGEMGDSHMGLQARLMSQALRKLAGAINKSKTVLIFINQLREKIGVMFGNPETTTGGRALKFYASVRLDIRKAENIKQDGEIKGSRTRVKVVKNKVAPPFREAEFDIVYGEGISRAGNILDMAVNMDIIEKSGSWFSYNGDRIGQGRENVKKYLKENPEILADVEQKVRANFAKAFQDSLGEELPEVDEDGEFEDEE